MKLFGSRSPVMKIVDTCVDDSPYNHRICEWVLAISDSKLYIACQMGTIRTPLRRIDPSTWTDSEKFLAPVPFTPANFYPEAVPEWHRFRRRKGEHSTAVFKKYRDPLKVVALTSDLDVLRYDNVARITEREITTCEFLRDHPCKNVAKYRGVLCKDVMKVGHDGHSVKLDTERVMKLVFKRYDCDLLQLIKKGTVIDAKYCLESVAAGLKHMHSLQVVHCDLKPNNIFMEANLSESASHAYEFVVGDFDSAAVTGSKHELKLGTEHWTRVKTNGIVEEEDDWYSFKVLKKWLANATGRKVEDFDGIGR